MEYWSIGVLEYWMNRNSKSQITNIKNEEPRQVAGAVKTPSPAVDLRNYYPMGVGAQRWPSSIATLPQPEQEYFIAASLSLHMCLVSVSGVPQKLHLAASPQGLHRCPGASATAPQFLQV